MTQVADLAPLHVPQALTVVDAARDLLPGVPHVACFDTVFHSGLTAAAREYAVPADWRHTYGLRRYGFHGLSYAWALARTAELLGHRPEQLHLVMVHLGVAAPLARSATGAVSTRRWASRLWRGW